MNAVPKIDTEAAAQIIAAAGLPVISSAPPPDVIAERLELVRLAFEEIKTSAPPNKEIKRETKLELVKVKKAADKFVDTLTSASDATLEVLRRHVLDDSRLAEAIESAMKVMTAAGRAIPEGKLKTRHTDYEWNPLIDRLASVYRDVFDKEPTAGYDREGRGADSPFIQFVVAFCGEADIWTTPEGTRDQIRNWQSDTETGEFIAHPS